MYQNLQDILSPLCPLISTRIGDPADKSTWNFEPSASATADQIAAATAAFNAISVQSWNNNEAIYAQIDLLEATQTDRRVREAVLGTDGGWLANLNAQIVALRGTLVKFGT